MNRRSVLQTAATAPFVVASPTVAASEDDLLETLPHQYFDALRRVDQDYEEVVIECAGELCSSTSQIPKKEIDAVVDADAAVDDLLRRLEIAIEILNEQDVTGTIDNSMIAAGRDKLGSATRYLPLLGSFNTLLEAACVLENATPDPDTGAVEDFVYASFAFGVEVALWTVGAPYQMAWRKTRFVSNRTFLRYADHGCNGCIVFLMSELHWGIRAAVYGTVSGDNLRFVADKVEELRELAEKLDEKEGYAVDIGVGRQEVRRLLSEGVEGVGGRGPQQKDGFLDRIGIEVDLPTFEVPELPDPSDLLDDLR